MPSLAAVGGIVRSELGTQDFLVLPFYYQLGATGLAFLVAISATATIVIGMNGLAKLQTAERDAGKCKASEVSALKKTTLKIKYELYLNLDS